MLVKMKNNKKISLEKKNDLRNFRNLVLVSKSRFLLHLKYF